MTTEIKTFEDLDCWKACRAIRLFIADLVVPILPEEVKFGMASQILRAARSTTINIAESYGRVYAQASIKFCSNSRSSCCEVLDHLIRANDENMISDDVLSEGRALIHKAIDLLNDYMTSLKKELKKGG